MSATEDWFAYAMRHIEDEGPAGVLARALATVCDPDIYDVRHVADRPKARQILADLAKRAGR